MAESTPGAAALALITAATHGGHDLVEAAWDEAGDIAYDELVDALAMIAAHMVVYIARETRSSVDDILSDFLPPGVEDVDRRLREQRDGKGMSGS